MDDNDKKMENLIAHYKKSNYTTCSPEDAAFMKDYIKSKLAEKDYSILDKMTKCDTPPTETFDLNEHYNSLYKKIAHTNEHPTDYLKEQTFSYNIKNFYDSYTYVDDPAAVSRIQSVFENISQPDKGASNKTLHDLKQNADIVFKVVDNSEEFDGECRLIAGKDDTAKPMFVISVTTKALKGSDSALATLLGHELSHAVDISQRPILSYTGSIGWQAPEDYANIAGADIAQNAGYDPKEFILAQGTSNGKTQRAAQVIKEHVLDHHYLGEVRQRLADHNKFTATPPSSEQSKFDVLRGTSGSPQPRHTFEESSLPNKERNPRPLYTR